MPTADQHRHKADKTRRFLAVVPVDDHPEWAAAVAFYVAVHRIEHLRRARGDGNSRGHADRLTYVRTAHTPLISPMEGLYTAAHVARYEAMADFFRLYDAAAVRDVVIAGWLTAVEAYVAVQTSPPEGAA